ncbi:MAG: ABC transporter permease [Armatimonadota bacterium]
MLGRFLTHRTGTVGAALTLMMTMVTILAPWLAPFPDSGDGGIRLDRRLQTPNAEHWFGTDNLGRDTFSRVLLGGRISLAIGALAVLLSGSVGSVVGIVAGYAGGWVNEISMRLADLFLGLPALVLAILVAMTLGGGLLDTVTAISIAWWPSYARLVRGEVIRIRDGDFVAAARMIGASDVRIMARHVFPNTVPSIIVQSSLLLGQAILVAASLSFIGLGAKPPSPEWGLTVATGREYIPDAWWISCFPGLAIMLAVIGFNLLGDGVRTVLDPRRISA